LREPSAANPQIERKLGRRPARIIPVQQMGRSQSLFQVPDAIDNRIAEFVESFLYSPLNRTHGLRNGAGGVADGLARFVNWRVPHVCEPS